MHILTRMTPPHHQYMHILTRMPPPHQYMHILTHMPPPLPPQYMHIPDRDKCNWIREKIETVEQVDGWGGKLKTSG